MRSRCQFRAGLITAAFSCALPIQAWAVPYGAASGGACAPGGRTTLAGAIAAAGAGGTVYVSEEVIPIPEVNTASFGHSVRIVGAKDDWHAEHCMEDPVARPVVEMQSQSLRAIEVPAGVGDKVVWISGVSFTHKVDGQFVTGHGGTFWLGGNSTLVLGGGADVSNGSASGNGGCIGAVRSTVIVDGMVQGCTASGSGGGVWIDRPNPHTQGRSFVSHLANNEAKVHGGGLYADRAPARLESAIGNRAVEGHGGAVYFTTAGVDQDVELQVYPSGTCDSGLDVCMGDNVAALDGGAIYITDPDSVLRMAGYYEDNLAEGDGAAIRATSSATVEICPTTRLRRNYAVGDGGGLHLDSVASANVRGECELSLVEFLPPYDPDDPVPPTIQVRQVLSVGDGPVEIELNRAGYTPAVGIPPVVVTPAVVHPDRLGGGVYLEGATLEIHHEAVTGLHEARFEGNVASLHGGGVAALGASAFRAIIEPLAQSTPILFVANATVDGLGGAVYASDAEVTLPTVATRVEFDANVADTSGGAVALVDGAELLMTFGTFVDNEAGTAGGGLFVDSASEAELGLCEDTAGVPEGCIEMVHNIAGSADGAAIDVVDGTVAVDRALVHGSDAAAGGAQVKVHAAGTAFIRNTVLGDAAIDGAVVEGFLHCNHCTLFDNDEAIVVDGSAVVRRSLFAENNTDINHLPGASLIGSCNTTAAATGVTGFGSVDAGAVVDDVGYPEVLTTAPHDCPTGLSEDLWGVLRPDPTGTGVPPYGAPASTISRYERGAYELFHRCGDGIQSPHEECDDGNTIDGDGCTATCSLP